MKDDVSGATIAIRISNLPELYRKLHEGFISYFSCANVICRLKRTYSNTYVPREAPPRSNFSYHCEFVYSSDVDLGNHYAIADCMSDGELEIIFHESSTIDNGFHGSQAGGSGGDSEGGSLADLVWVLIAALARFQTKTLLTVMLSHKVALVAPLAVALAADVASDLVTPLIK